MFVLVPQFFAFSVVFDNAVHYAGGELVVLPLGCLLEVYIVQLLIYLIIFLSKGLPNSKNRKFRIKTHHEDVDGASGCSEEGVEGFCQAVEDWLSAKFNSLVVSED